MREAVIAATLMGLIGWNVSLELRMRKFEAIQGVAAQALRVASGLLDRIHR